MGYLDDWTLVGPVVCIRASSRAVAIRFEDKDSWVPRSILHAQENEIRNPGDAGMLVVKTWFAKKVGWL